MSVLYALGGVGKQTALGLHNTFQPSPYHHLDHEESSKLLFFYTYSFHPFKSCQQNKEWGSIYVQWIPQLCVLNFNRKRADMSLLCQGYHTLRHWLPNQQFVKEITQFYLKSDNLKSNELSNRERKQVQWGLHSRLGDCNIAPLIRARPIGLLEDQPLATWNIALW